MTCGHAPRRNRGGRPRCPRTRKRICGELMTRRTDPWSATIAAPRQTRRRRTEDRGRALRLPMISLCCVSTHSSHPRQNRMRVHTGATPHVGFCVRGYGLRFQVAHPIGESTEPHELRLRYASADSDPCDIRSRSRSVSSFRGSWGGLHSLTVRFRPRSAAQSGSGVANAPPSLTPTEVSRRTASPNRSTPTR